MDFTFEVKEHVYLEKTPLLEKQKLKDISTTKHFLKAKIANIFNKEKNLYDVLLEDHAITLKSIGSDVLFKVKNPETIDIDDLTQIMQINKVDLLNNILNRYNRKEIYTLVGETLLVTNPFEFIDVYNNKYLEYYINYSRKGEINNSNINCNKNNDNNKYKSGKIKPPFPLSPSPHIYKTVGNMIENLLSSAYPQALIISGESGAGKTESAKQAMKMITYFFEYINHKSEDMMKRRVSNVIKRKSLLNDLNKSRSNLKKAELINENQQLYEFPLEEKIISCNPILESFGNCKTLRNDNSSRFGKYVKLYVDLTKKEICGAYINTYLLEKSRVSKLNFGERNYHFFYQLICGVCEIFLLDFNLNSIIEEYLSHLISDSRMINGFKEIINKDFLLKLGLFDDKNKDIKSSIKDYRDKEVFFVNSLKAFKYLESDIYQFSKFKTPIHDVKEFFITIESMLKTGFSISHIKGILELTAVILHLGNLEFRNKTTTEVEKEAAEKLNNTYSNNTSEQLQSSDFIVNNVSTFTTISSLLKLDQKKLEESLTYNVRVIQSKKIFSPILSIKELNNLRDSLAKELYQRIFNSLISVMNDMLLKEDLKEEIMSNKERYSYIGLLDIFGFECFEENGFEQFCINYANEKLQQLYINDIFKENERLFKQEGLEQEYKSMSFVDNQNIIDILDKHPTGFFFLLDNESNVKGKDTNLLEQIIKIESKQNKNNNNNKTSKDDVILKKSLKLNKFIISHSAMEVEYSIDGFVEKNLDDLNPLVKEVLLVSKNSNISFIMKFESPLWPKYLGGKFRTNLSSLVEELKNSKCNYVRCLKPNSKKLREYFDEDMTYSQIQYLGVFDTIRIRQEGFSVRINFGDFYFKFSEVMKTRDKYYQLSLVNKDDCKEILNALDNKANDNTDKKEDTILFGITLIFITQKYYNFLQLQKAKLLERKNKASSKISATYKSYKKKAQFKLLKLITPRIQHNFRTQKIRRYYMKLREKAKMIQKAVRFLVLGKNKALKYRKSINIIKRMISKLKARIRNKKMMRLILMLKNKLMLFQKRIKLNKLLIAKAMIQEIIEKSINYYFNQVYFVKIVKIQNYFRLFQFNKKNSAVLSKCNEIKIRVRTHFSCLLIQSMYRMYLIRKAFIIKREGYYYILSCWKSFILRRWLNKLRNSVNMIRVNWINHHFKGKVFDDHLEFYLGKIRDEFEEGVRDVNTALFGENYNNKDFTNKEFAYKDNEDVGKFDYFNELGHRNIDINNTKLIERNEDNKKFSLDDSDLGNSYNITNNNIKTNNSKNNNKSVLNNRKNSLNKTTTSKLNDKSKNNKNNLYKKTNNLTKFITTSTNKEANISLLDSINPEENYYYIINRNKFNKLIDSKNKLRLNKQIEKAQDSSVLIVSQFEDPKLHFFSHIVDIELYSNLNEHYNYNWADTLKQLMCQNVKNLNSILEISLGSFHTTCLNSKGCVYSWGNNSHGQLMTDASNILLLNEINEINGKEKKRLKNLSINDDTIEEIGYNNNNKIDYSKFSLDYSEVNDTNNTNNLTIRNQLSNNTNNNYINEEKYSISHQTINITDREINTNNANNKNENKLDNKVINIKNNRNSSIKTRNKASINTNLITTTNNNNTKNNTNTTNYKLTITAPFKTKTTTINHSNNNTLNQTTTTINNNDTAFFINNIILDKSHINVQNYKKTNKNITIDDILNKINYKKLLSKDNFKYKNDNKNNNNNLISNFPYSPDNIKARQITSGEDYSLIITKDYQLLVSGNNYNYQLGIKDNTPIFYPFNYSNYLKIYYPEIKDTRIKEAKSTGNNVLFCTLKGELYLCSNFNSLSKKFFPLINYDLGMNIKVDSFECGKGFAIILTTTGNLFSVGDNMFGQLGVGDYHNRKQPTEIVFLKDVGAKATQISCGFKHVVIKSSSGNVYSWGNVSIYLFIPNFILIFEYKRILMVN